MNRLSDTRIRILSVLDMIQENEAAPDAREIAERCGEHRRASDWASGALREMAHHGLVTRLGITLRNSRTWQITRMGRTALKAALADRAAA